uniref:Uncharacterized protein n=1 Tax=Anopheles minimus TaxID=112268 RepID=A0A182WNY3_9DIPT
RRKLAAGHLERNLHAAVPDVVEVLHATGQRVPGGTIRDAILERGRCGFARDAARHLTVVIRVRQRQMLEHVVVRRQRRLRLVAVED